MMDRKKDLTVVSRTKGERGPEADMEGDLDGGLESATETDSSDRNGDLLEYCSSCRER